jgi:hypothetical protein
MGTDFHGFNFFATEVSERHRELSAAISPKPGLSLHFSDESFQSHFRGFTPNEFVRQSRNSPVPLSAAAESSVGKSE